MDLVLHIWLIDSIWVYQQLENLLTLFVMCLIEKDSLINTLVFFLSQCLKDIIVCFENLICIPNICEAIDGTHIPLVDLLSKRVTLAIGDFFNRKKVL
jgi:hypothetical protein